MPVDDIRCDQCTGEYMIDAQDADMFATLSMVTTLQPYHDADYDAR